MLNTLSIDMKTPNIRIFPKKLHSLSILCAEYFQKIGKFAILCTNTHNSNILVGENSEKSGFSMNRKEIFVKYLQFCMWVYKGIKVNISATTQKNHYSINLQNKSCTNYHNYCRKPWKFVKLGTSHNRKYPIQKLRNSHLL